MNERLFFVGPGRVGLALGAAFVEAGAVDALTFCGRRPDPPAHPLFTEGTAEYLHGLEQPPEGTTAVFLTVPDGVVPEMAHALAGRGSAPEGCAAFHASGVLSADPLAPLHVQGYSVGSMHPLQTIAHPVSGAQRLPGSYFAISGEPEALTVARRLLFPLGARSITVPTTRRPLYHAAAVMASNHLLVVLAAASRLLIQAGAPEDEALDALIPLARGTIENLAELGPADALTGPIARGDVETVELHLRMMEPRDRTLYIALGREALDLAEGRLDPAVVDRLNTLFESRT
jgi:predicted short-subunit dehydrogenase-like oxidoreductase (DUF2520 family)